MGGHDILLKKITCTPELFEKQYEFFDNLCEDDTKTIDELNDLEIMNSDIYDENIIVLSLKFYEKINTLSEKVILEKLDINTQFFSEFEIAIKNFEQHKSDTGVLFDISFLRCSVFGPDGARRCTHPSSQAGDASPSLFSGPIGAVVRYKLLGARFSNKS